MSVIAEIQEPIKEELEKFEIKFSESMKSSVPLLDKITHYIIKRKGKQMRPMFVFLSAKAFGKVTESTYTAASLIELLHTATLVHDDVVDDAYERRGFFSVSALWKNKVAVLVGDYLLSRGLLLSVDTQEFGLLRIVSDAVQQMSEGELLQLEKARRLDIDEKIYFEIIRQKTAVLIAACCSAGAASAGASADEIKDDLFDYGSEDKIGKPTGIDIKERKMTLPLIYALNNANSADKRRIINTVKNNNNNPEKVKEVINYVLGSGGIEYASQKMHDYKNEALSLLKDLPETPALQKLTKLVTYTVERKK
jgi:octaprenyl-diphosphate synthase